jgi:hypothetical protein
MAEDPPLSKTEIMDVFVRQHIKVFEDVEPLLDALKRRFKTRKWPQASVSTAYKSFRCVDKLLSILAHGKETEFLTDYLGTKSHTAMRQTVFKEDPDYLVVLAHIREMLDHCHKQWELHGPHNPILNSVRTNLLKLLTGLKGKGRDKLREEGFMFTTNGWTQALAEVSAHAMNVYQQDDVHWGRQIHDENLRSAVRDQLTHSTSVRKKAKT